jgi:hypothetical protein
MRKRKSFYFILRQGNAERAVVHIHMHIRCIRREGGPNRWSTVLITALWAAGMEKPVPRGHAHTLVYVACCPFINCIFVMLCDGGGSACPAAGGSGSRHHVEHPGLDVEGSPSLFSCCQFMIASLSSV